MIGMLILGAGLGAIIGSLVTLAVVGWFGARAPHRDNAERNERWQAGQPVLDVEIGPEHEERL